MERFSPGVNVDDINTIEADLKQFETEKCQETLIRSNSHRFLRERLHRGGVRDEGHTASIKKYRKLNINVEHTAMLLRFLMFFFTCCRKLCSAVRTRRKIGLHLYI